jgi:NAD(P)-dependent dehydrogenase (short-subunit alcohol dehydrogenase family)
MVTEAESEARVALVAGATRGAGRAIAVELARTGLFVYATGRSSRVSGASEMDRPETIEETGEPIRAAGGSRPDCWGYLAAYGWDQDHGKGIDQFR